MLEEKLRYTAKDIAKELGCSTKTIKQIARKSSVAYDYAPTLRGGGKVLTYSRSAAERIIEIYRK